MYWRDDGRLVRPDGMGTDVYAVNASAFLHYDGATWSASKLPGQGDSWVAARAAEAIWGISSKDIVVAAVDGAWRCHM